MASIASGFLLYRSELRQQKLARLWSLTLRHPTAIAIFLGALTIAIAFRVSAFMAFGADSYGYVSQAHLWSSGHLVQQEPLALRVPWPQPEWTFSPLGYRPGVEPGTIVPTYPPGLPMVMAGLLVLLGRDGPFFAVPLLGAMAIVTAFVLGRRVAGEVCGLAAATLLLTSPVFLYQLKEPMSDVPVTAWWLLAIVLASTTTPWLIFSGGLAATAAILTRPNIVPLAAVLGLYVLFGSAKEPRRRIVNACLFAAAVIPGGVAVALINARLYGSSLASGYGGMSELFKVEYFWTNLSQYPRWLVGMETPFILLAGVGWYLLRRGEAAQGASQARIRRSLSSLFVAFAAVLYACYAVYLPFDNWTFLRFLLPAIALLLVLCALALSNLTARLTSFLPKFLVSACFVVFLAWRWDVTGLKPPTPYERKAVVVAEYVQDHLPPNAILISMLHSGSIRYYAGRRTLRWDWLAHDWLDRSLEFLASNGYHPYLLIEDSERAEFMKMFSANSRIGSLGLTPMATYYGGSRVDLYDLGNSNPPAATARIGLRSRE